MDLFLFLIVFFAGFLAAFVGVLVGGGGLLTIPLLIFFGLPPTSAVASSKVGSFGAMASGWYSFNKEGKVDYKIGVPLALISVIGAILGATVLVFTPDFLMEKLIAVLMAFSVLLIFVKKDFGLKKTSPTSLMVFFGFLSFIVVGFWSSFFGAATGIIASYVLIFFFGQTFLESAGTRKISGTITSIVALIIFQLNNLINWNYGLPLFFGMSFGAFFGTKYGVKKGEKWVKHLFAIIVFASAIKLLFF